MHTQATNTENQEVAPTTPSVENVSVDTQKSILEPKVETTGLTRKKIEAMEDVRIVDREEIDGESLEMFCYNKSPSETTDIKALECRGIVFHGDNLVLPGYPYTYEHTTADMDKLVFGEDFFADAKIFVSHEGNLIKLFYFNNRWYIATNRKFNAFKSKWASKDSFGTLFKKALTSLAETSEEFRAKLPEGEEPVLDKFYSLLNPSKQYIFLTRNSEENRIVCSPPDVPTVYHVGTFIDGKLDIEENVGVPFPEALSFASAAELKAYVEGIDYTKSQGVIIFLPNNCHQVKIYNTEYMNLFRLRGNEPSIKFRYLQVRMDKKQRHALAKLYPNNVGEFQKYEELLYDISKIILGAYTQRYIKKNYVTVPRQEYKVIKACHDWHREDMKNNRISQDKVMEILNEQAPTDINNMLRRFNSEKIEKAKLQERRDRTSSGGRLSSSVYGSSPAPQPTLLRPNA